MKQLPREIAYIIGIDPGTQGAIAILRRSDLALVDLHDMPVMRAASKGARLAATLFCDIVKPYAADAICVLEEGHAQPPTGIASAFTQGAMYGAVLALLQGALTCPVHLVAPHAWKARVGIRVAGAADKTKAQVRKAAKGQARGEAGLLYPAHASSFARVSDDGRAEAVLIARAGALTPGLLGA